MLHLGEDAQGVLKDAGPFTLEDLPGPMKPGAAQEPDDDVANVLLVRFDVLRITVEMALKGTDIPECRGLKKRLCSFVPNGICRHGEVENECWSTV